MMKLGVKELIKLCIYRLYRKCVDQIPHHSSDSPPFAFHRSYRFANDADWVLVCTVCSALGKRLYEGSYIYPLSID
jgi:hypothetical protein